MRIPTCLLFVPLFLSTLASAADPAPLGAANFLPTPENPIGWRGDGTGRYPGATPPKEWYIRLKNCPGLACASVKTADAPKLDPVPDLALNDWITIGPWVADGLKEAMDTAYLPDELAAEPKLGDKVGENQWKKLPTQNSAVNFADIYGETQRDPGQNVWDAPKKQKLIYAFTYVYDPTGGEVNLFTTHPNGFRLYVNGKVASKSESTGQGAGYGGIPRMNRVTLAPGWNRILLKSCGCKRGPIDNGWAFSAWMQKLPGKGAKLETESKNIVYQLELPHGNHGKAPGPIVVGNKLFLTGEHYLAAFRKQGGQFLWHRTIIAFDGKAQDMIGAKDNAEAVTQYNAACQKMHDLDEQYPQQFKDGKLAPAFEKERKQVGDELSALLAKLDPARVSKLKGAWEQGEPGWAMSPCSDGRFVYVWSELAVAACFDLAGKVQWTTTVDHAGDIHHGFANAPLLSDGKFICSQANIWAFDAKTGKLAWNAPRKGSQWGSLIRAKSAGQTVLVEQGNFLRSLADGQLLSGDKGGSKPGENCCSTSIPIDGSLAFGTFGTFDLVDLKTALHATIPWPESVNCGGLYADANIASPLYHDGYAYVFTMGGTLITVDINARKIAAAEHLDTRVCWGGRPGITASPSFAGGNLYLFDDSGNTLIRTPGPAGKVLAKNPLFTGPPNYTGICESTNSTPTFDESRIYWRINNRLICIGEK